MFWIIDSALKHERAFPDLMNALQRLDVPHVVVKAIPFGGGIIPDISRENPVMVMGTYSMEKLCKEKNWFPGMFTNDNFTYEEWSEKYKGFILNEDATVIEMGKINTLSYEDDKEFFTRPCEDGKEYAGEIATWKSFREWANRVLDMKEDFYKTITSNTKILLASVKKIYSEYRFFVVDGKVVTGSQYKIGSRVQYTEFIDKPIINFAQHMANIWSPALAFVIDIADTPDGYKVIEINCMNSAGFYACDMLKLVHAIEKLDFNSKIENQEDINGIVENFNKPVPHLLAKISLSKDKYYLIYEALTNKDIEGKISLTGGSKIGTTVLDTKKHLGITRSALPILKDMFKYVNTEHRGGDLGDIDWFISTGDQFNFGWLGPVIKKIHINEEIHLSSTDDAAEASATGQFVLLEDDE